MKIHLIHHAEALTAEQDPRRPLSPPGRQQADRIGMRLRALGVSPARILHSDKLWTIETAQRIAAILGQADRTAQAAYAINTGDALEPFLSEISASRGDIMMCGHFEYLQRAAAQLVCGDEHNKVVEFKPGNGTVVCIEGEAGHWVITYMWRADHAPG